MLKRIAALSSMLVVALAGCGTPQGAAPAADSSEAGDTAPMAMLAPAYADVVLPIIQERCASCHIEQSKGRLSLTDHAAAMAGGKSGDVVVPGNAEASLLYTMVAGIADKQMPPKGDPLTGEQIEAIKGWIEAGAK